MERNNVRYGWSDVIDEYVTKTEPDKVRQNTHDDFGLGRGWVFVGGRYVVGVWTTLWAKPTEATMDRCGRQMCDGPVVSLRCIRWADGDVRMFATDHTGIPSYPAGILDGIPDDVAPFVHGSAALRAECKKEWDR